MSQYIVSARKYRPARFSDVIGQEQVTNTLKNALKSNQLAQAFLFCGPRGVGKTTCARILAKMINCDQPSEDYDICNDPGEQDHAFSIFELDAASNNSVDNIRELIDQVRFAPPEGKKKVYIIDEVHMLSAAAFNAFLKTLEEPPPYAIFILATTEKHKILPTILSRCQIFDFSRIQVDAIVEQLQHIAKEENIEADDRALHIIAQKADGALRDALSIFDRMVSFGNGKVGYEEVLENLNLLDYDYYFKLTEQCISQDVPAVLNTFDEISKKGFEGDMLINGFAEHLRNILVSKEQGTHHLLEVGEEVKKEYLKHASLVPVDFILNALDICNKTDIHYKAAKNKRLHVEMALIKLCHLQAMLYPSTQNTEKKKPLANSEVEGVSSEVKGTSSESSDVQNLDLQKSDNQNSEVQSSDNQLSKDQSSIATPQSQILKPQSSIENPSANKSGYSMPDLSAMEANLRKAKAEEKSKLENKPSIDQIQLNEAEVETLILHYTEELKKRSKSYLAGLLREVIFELKGGLILFKVDSNVKQEHLKGEQENMLRYMAEKLDQPHIVIDVIADESLKKEKIKIPYSPKERLLEIIKENPNIKNLIERLDLHLDY